jgi:hypothetical protein
MSTTSPSSTSCPLRPTGVLPPSLELKSKLPSAASSSEPSLACLPSSNQDATHLPLIGLVLQGLTEDVVDRRSLPVAVECQCTPLLFPLIVARPPWCVSIAFTLPDAPSVRRSCVAARAGTPSRLSHRCSTRGDRAQAKATGQSVAQHCSLINFMISRIRINF